MKENIEIGEVFGDLKRQGIEGEKPQKDLTSWVTTTATTTKRELDDWERAAKLFWRVKKRRKDGKRTWQGK